MRAVLGLEDDVAVADVLVGVLVLGQADSPGLSCSLLDVATLFEVSAQGLLGGLVAQAVHKDRPFDFVVGASVSSLH